MMLHLVFTLLLGVAVLFLGGWLFVVRKRVGTIDENLRVEHRRYAEDARIWKSAYHGLREEYRDHSIKCRAEADALKTLVAGNPTVTLHAACVRHLTAGGEVRIAEDSAPVLDQRGARLDIRAKHPSGDYFDFTTEVRLADLREQDAT